ncbi:hypothetical protein MPTK1_1g15840 [Marchantia polymorpha subsp. ruderalis]|uniref:Uncharacterized protein n=2 Tax=Marchantia polymorpha TaxID=3197 RepID=A0AAF6AQL8_MARPO|nr:hypothetical protein MARPO_0033s0077 [Marchantia polymorpha]BBM98738.1 hypothetical protein Mp_1g15840 [Marchantia polymorpha subsp. ruderalis]|eukprot:PTQ41668.1 hypothetical protein MARPO_0033s0077 [Marchantia polymorpha]
MAKEERAHETWPSKPSEFWMFGLAKHPTERTGRCGNGLAGIRNRPEPPSARDEEASSVEASVPTVKHVTQTRGDRRRVDLELEILAFMVKTTNLEGGASFCWSWSFRRSNDSGRCWLAPGWEEKPKASYLGIGVPEITDPLRIVNEL